MLFPICSRSLCRLESELLRTKEDVKSWENDLGENGPGLNFLIALELEEGVWWLRQMWRSFQKSTMSLDHQMKREEKSAQFFELLAGIILHLEQNFFHVLQEIRTYMASDGNCPEIRLDTFQFRRFAEVFEEFVEFFAGFVTSGLESALKLVVPALVLLSFMYQYLIGCVDKVGGKTYSPGSFLFRLIFVAIVLFLGSYVWIKSRQASYTTNRRKRKLGDESVGPGGVYCRPVKDSSGSVTRHKYEPRFKPLREKLESGTTLKFDCLPLGSYDTRREAEIVRHIAVVLYGEEEGHPVQFGEGLCLPFPSVTEREKCPPSGKEKADWVTQKTKELYAELLTEKARRSQLLHPAGETTGSHHGHVGEASRPDPSPSAPVIPSTAIDLACFTSPLRGDGIVEQPRTSAPHGLGQEAPVAREVFPASASERDFEQFVSSLFQFEANDFPAMDQIEGDYSETDRICSFQSTPEPPQSSALDIPTTAIVASRPQLGGVGQGLEVMEPPLNSATAINFQQLKSLPEQVQLQVHVTCQETRPEEFAGSNIELQQKLLESEERISELKERNSGLEKRNLELEQELLQFMVENEEWRSMFRQLAKLI